MSHLRGVTSPTAGAAERGLAGTLDVCGYFRHALAAPPGPNYRTGILSDTIKPPPHAQVPLGKSQAVFAACNNSVIKATGRTVTIAGERFAARRLNFTPLALMDCDRKRR